MSNNRVHYPIHYPAFGVYCSGVFTPAYGVQSIPMTTNFNLEQVFQLGQLDVYENSETVPEIEVTVEKVLDGNPLIYHLASQDATSPTLLNRSNRRCDMVLSIFDDDYDNASGTPRAQAMVSGLYIQSLTYNLPVDGQATESVSLVGNDKIWRTSGFYFSGHFNGNGAPASGEAVQRRQHVVMGLSGSIWPKDIQNLDSTGYNLANGATYNVHFQNVSISTNLNRNSLFELGKRREFFKFANFPVEVTCEIGVLAAGTNPGDGVNADADALLNTADRTIKIVLEDSTIFDLGTKNRLQSINYSGGDASGGEVTLSYSYRNFNVLKITQDNDPAGQV